MNISSYTSKTIDELFKELGSTSHGLSTGAALEKQEKYGKNEFKSTELKWWNTLLRQFKSPFLYLLVGAAALSIFLGAHIDGIMILVFVLINAGLGFYQEFKSQQTLQLLKQYVVEQANVLRDGKEVELDSVALVPGDIILLESGDIIPADARLIEEDNLTIDESILTGESIAIKKIAQPIQERVRQMFEAKNIVFSGTTVVTGKAKALIVATGQKTSMGEITHLTVETSHQSSFEKGVSRFSSFILKLILSTLVILFVVNLFIKGPSADIPTLLIFSIALAVSVIPEALPVIMTFSMARGALHLAKQNVVVKRLSAIEDLGSIEILCTDKTGTLTENYLSINSFYPEENRDLVLYGALGGTLLNQKNHSAHSFDISLMNALTAEERKHFTEYERLVENPFDPSRKCGSLIVKKGMEHTLIVRGAPEVLLSLSENMNPTKSNEAIDWIRSQGQQGKRVLGIATKPIISSDVDKGVDLEKNLNFVGIVSFVDSIKQSAYEAVKQAEELGVVLKVLTGDSPEVAGAVAQQIGLIDNPLHVMSGDAFDALPIHKQHLAVYEYSVFARVSPQQKHRIIELLEEKKEVGFLGEGINDAPALKTANVAIVVDGATDVARDAADIILLQRSLKTIVDGIKEGRGIFANTSKYIRATLSSNFGNFYTVAIASLFVPFLPLLPIQLLLINLLTDFPMITVATDTVDKNELARPRNYDIKEIALIGTWLGVVSTVFDFIFFVMFYRQPPAVLQTYWFMGSVFTELVFLFSIRTKFPFYKALRPSNTIVLFSVLAFLTALILPFTTVGQKVFSFVQPSIFTVLLILVIVAVYFCVTEVVKVLYYSRTADSS